MRKQRWTCLWLLSQAGMRLMWKFYSQRCAQIKYIHTYIYEYTRAWPGLIYSFYVAFTLFVSRFICIAWETDRYMYGCMLSSMMHHVRWLRMRLLNDTNVQWTTIFALERWPYPLRAIERDCAERILWGFVLPRRTSEMCKRDIHTTAKIIGRAREIFEWYEFAIEKRLYDDIAVRLRSRRQPNSSTKNYSK